MDFKLKMELLPVLLLLLLLSIQFRSGKKSLKVLKFESRGKFYHISFNLSIDDLAWNVFLKNLLFENGLRI